MTDALALLCYAAAVGVLAPKALTRGTWSYRSPALAVVLWQGLAVSFTLAAALASYHLITPTRHLHNGMSGLLHFCGLALDTYVPGLTGVPAFAVPVGVILLPLMCFGHHLIRARRARARHRSVLDLVGRRSARLRATVLDHETPVAYALPGRRPRIVVSSGALRVLSPAELDTVLEHERAHVAGRHHLALAAAEAFATAFRWLPLARAAREQTALLLEMAADDRALRRHPREVLASALYAMAGGRTPQGAFPAGGPDAAVRLRRMLAPRGPVHPVPRGVVAAGAAAVPLLPLVVGCMPCLV
ncbi:M56 family metallopeptidase [Streptomyces sp. NA02950]|uniref:M56 family metallopeptidase n=1 Tax=Streptomyces sp. NA02950 TaxID=2742137 RepID=UPI0015910756|nr:M56 family metallopeptidase [Streptomyces sp. NA02950]QKV96772.1 M56 family metallopeptidase [Streptomyces sp. NA02950]